MAHCELDKLKLEIKQKAKNGIDFIFAAAFIWTGLFFIWRLNLKSYDKSVLAFMFGALMLPTALLFSKLFHTKWKIRGNSLQPLGLWLNFAQLVYFPFLVFVLIQSPDYFIMTYAIITGAHLFPYAWFYNANQYALAAVVVSVGSLILALLLSPENMMYIPLYTALILLVLGTTLYLDTKKLAAELQA